MTDEIQMEPESKAEELVLKAVKTGDLAEVSSGLDVANDTVWGADETIRAEFIRHICIHPNIYNMDSNGLQILGARIDGVLNLQYIKFEFSVCIVQSRFIDEPHLYLFTVPFLNFNSTFFKHGLAADSLKCGGDVFLKNIQSQGEVHLVGADIKGNVSCHDAKFENMGKYALSADLLRCGGSVFLDNIQAQGKVRFLGANIKGDLSCDKAKFENETVSAFDAQRLCVRGRLFWQDLATRPKGDIDFRHAHVGDLVDDLDSWPEMGKLWLDGFTYDNLACIHTAKDRIAWLDRMGKSSNEFYPQPYEQLIKVLKKTGHEQDAKEIAMAKQDAYARYLKCTHGVVKGRRFWLWMLKTTAGYGYKPLRTFYCLMLICFLSMLVFAHANTIGFMRPSKDRVYSAPEYSYTVQDCETKDGWHYVFSKSKVPYDSFHVGLCLPNDYSEFNSLIYSLDTLIPILDLKQESNWEPASTGLYGGFFRFYLWGHIVLGWILTTIAVAGFTGIIKKD